MKMNVKLSLSLYSHPTIDNRWGQKRVWSPRFWWRLYQLSWRNLSPTSMAPHYNPGLLEIMAQNAFMERYHQSIYQNWEVANLDGRATDMHEGGPKDDFRDWWIQGLTDFEKFVETCFLSTKWIGMWSPAHCPWDFPPRRPHLLYLVRLLLFSSPK